MSMEPRKPIRRQGPPVRFLPIIIGFCKGGVILNPPTAEQYEATRIIGCQQADFKPAVGVNFLDSKAKMDDNVVESRRP